MLVHTSRLLSALGCVCGVRVFLPSFEKEGRQTGKLGWGERG